jgi:type IV pilus assembly protein PilB
MDERMSTSNTTDSMPLTKPLGILLQERGLVTEEQIQEALARQKEQGHRKLLGEMLVELQFVTEDQVTEVLADAYGVPYARITPRVADPKIIELLPREFIEKQCVLPLFLVNGKLTVAVPEPANLFLIEEIEKVSGKPVQIVAATARDIQQTMQAYLPAANVFVIDEIVDDIQTKDFAVVEQQITDIANLEEVAGQSPVIKLVNYLVYSAVHDGASDIHIEPDDGVLRVRYRVDGKLFEKITPPFQMHAAVVSRIKIMAQLDISERRVPQDGGIHVQLDGRPVDLRVSAPCPRKHGEKVVIRIIDNSNILVSLEKVGFSYQMLKTFKEVIHQPNGILLVTGPTGSGKSDDAVLGAGRDQPPDVNICTVEDPVEFNLPGVNQFQVNEKAGFNFTNALRALLRQDPDIIMLGEIRDQDTAKIATQAALTGHLVLSYVAHQRRAQRGHAIVQHRRRAVPCGRVMRAVLASDWCVRSARTAKSRSKSKHRCGRPLRSVVGNIEAFYHGKGCGKCP